MKMYCLDAEWNGDKADVIHVIVVKQYPTGHSFTFTDMPEFKEWVKKVNPDRWFIHAGQTADVPVINNYFNETVIDPDKVIDTFVVSRTVNYSKFFTHSLKELGEHLKVYKGDYTGGWDTCSPGMITYCEGDADVLKAIVKFYWSEITDPNWATALKTENQIAALCGEMKMNGFEFDIPLAEQTLKEVKGEMKELEDSFHEAFGEKLEEVKRLKLRYTKDGTLFKSIQKAISEYPKVEFDDEDVIVYDYVRFNPGSPKQRIDVLWDAKWEPVEKTKGHLAKLREGRSKWRKTR